MSRPNYMNSDNKEETGIMIELYSSPDGRIANVAENVYPKNDEVPSGRCLKGNGEVYFEIERIIDYCSNLKSENPHHVKANYVKKIEVEK